MRLAKTFLLISVLFVFFGAVFLVMEGVGETEVQSPSGRPAMWGDDVVVHSGYITRFSRNGFSSDYDDDSNHVYVAVVGYSSGPDTCWLYKSTDGGSGWTMKSYWPDNVDISNPQVVVGEGSNHYLFLFGRVNEENGNIVVNRMPLPSGSWTSYTIGGPAACDIRNFAAAGEQGPVYNLHLAFDSDSGRTYYLRSSSYGESWTYYDTVDGDQPHLATAGLDGAEELYLTWRLDGETGALCGVQTQRFFVKALNLGKGKVKYVELPFSVYAAGLDSIYCLFHDNRGNLYVGAEDANSDGDFGKIFRSTDGGRNWSTDTLVGSERVMNIIEWNGFLWAATGENARVFRSIDGESWWSPGTIGGSGDKNAYCLAGQGYSDAIYVGTGNEGDVFKSTDMGNSWVEVAGDLTGADRIYSIIVTSAGTLLAGAYEEGDSIGLFRSTDDGLTWTERRPSGVKSVHSLFQASDGTIYAGVATSSGYYKVIKSTEASDGYSWTYTTYQETGSPRNIMEDSEGAIYVTNTSGFSDDYVMKTTNQGTSWTPVSVIGGTITDLIQSQPHIAVKKSTNRGVNWQAAQIISEDIRDRSDPKVAASQGTANYTVWIAYSRVYDYSWSIPFVYSTDKGATWIAGSEYLASGSMDQQLCDLRVKRGYNYVHAAYYDEITGSRKVYYKWSHYSNPDSWTDSLCISGIIPTETHTPEISFYGNNTMVFFCGQAFAIPSPYPYILYVDGSHFATGVEEEEESALRVQEFSLSQNYPNPFNPSTTIHFSVRRSSLAVHSPIHTSLRVYNVLGQLVKTLVDERKQAGDYQVVWDGKDELSEEVTSGVYLCRLQVGEQSQTKKMIMLK